MSTEPNHDAQSVIDACLALGFALAGVAPAEPTAWRQQFLDWLAAGSHGDMGYLTEHLEERLDVRVLLPGAKAVIVVADQYAEPGEQIGPADQTSSEPTGRIARYAQGRDYHEVIRKRLWTLVEHLRQRFPGSVFRPFVDSGPALEREHAVRAGLGGMFIGKHTLAISPSMGSYLLLGGVATTLTLSPSGSGPSVDHCGSCTRCIDACPTSAITPWRVDATKCISYLTLEHQGEVAPTLHKPMGDWLAGCDICQDVCPFNAAGRANPASPRVHPAYEPDPVRKVGLPILEVLSWSEADRSRVLSQSAAKRASLIMLKRSALIAAGNVIDHAPHPGLLAAIRRIAEDASEPDLLRNTARVVLESSISR